MSTRCKGKARYKLAWENCFRQSEVLLLGGAAPHINALQLFSLKPFFPNWAYLWKLNVMQSKFISMWALLDTDNKNIVPSTLQEPNITSVLRKPGLMTSHKAENCEKDQVTRKIKVQSNHLPAESLTHFLPGCAFIFTYLGFPSVATDNNHHFLLFQTHWLEFVFFNWMDNCVGLKRRKFLITSAAICWETLGPGSHVLLILTWTTYPNTAADQANSQTLTVPNYMQNILMSCSSNMTVNQDVDPASKLPRLKASPGSVECTRTSLIHWGRHSSGCKGICVTTRFFTDWNCVGLQI